MKEKYGEEFVGLNAGGPTLDRSAMMVYDLSDALPKEKSDYQLDVVMKKALLP